MYIYEKYTKRNMKTPIDNTKNYISLDKTHKEIYDK